MWKVEERVMGWEGGRRRVWERGEEVWEGGEGLVSWKRFYGRGGEEGVSFFGGVWEFWEEGWGFGCVLGGWSGVFVCVCLWRRGVSVGVCEREAMV